MPRRLSLECCKGHRSILASPASPIARPPLIPVPGEFLSRRVAAEAGTDTLCPQATCRRPPGGPWEFSGAMVPSR